MKAPDTPQDEQARLETLRSLGILDSPAEERFDRLTRMAKRLFGVPIALVSLIDENRQWFKSCFGLSVNETSRDISFCGHAILGNDLFLIPDTLADERFADNPLVLNDPYIRFYAGCPLRAPNGNKLGTLCIIDRQPRNFGRDELEALIDLAAMVEREISAVQLATLDELTKISNRRGFMMLAQHSLHLCARQKLAASLVYMDLDKFKPINDTFGHAEGDRALTVFAEQLKAACRGSDILARLGGDEFAILLIDTSRERTGNVVSRLCESVENYNREARRGYAIAFSHGIVEFDPEKHPTLDAMMAEGDALMYGLKRSKAQLQQR
ncbi:sensor domain-containing diguanylate cyclase [Pseudomonas sp. N040]|uniref:sensor domain-containing diguanylate cyclase n=1 Tax=Pseudomonas sp. N040 TaxID=2785325 RepID=UPI0018A3136E|nr:sensor domain-containing diguanylate cyclase [Pseudomonas sp. N040]MBF7731308.1 sensor domain-containing diguanylate cyclase [Pseudomonas sp. N040]MBW7014951.1 sensor domain-containing diguanylate cyclase [Pseudomonas sp. N040]